MSAMFNKDGLAAALAGVDDSAEAREAIERLQASDLAKIDALILSSLDRSWKKAGFVTTGVLIAAPDEYEDIPEALYALRIRALANDSRIEVKGDLEVLKTCQIRLSSASGGG
ncbi:hypothetical protein ARC78_03465 [Stenotrophomonas pictorum JCM 9942]|uniref:DUF3658 domain-containing protein n=2 Tax=Stenotrophomonas pictorum TaxID=86184 RepID=A0A0R0AUI3_9GAMM|nr:hypothetical protein ARC78_03465 [Stenotrophomonas pictorum JCM 9942]